MKVKGKGKGKKAKKSSKKRHDDWELDGGAGIVDSQVQEDHNSRFHNQERDERIRRGNLKQIFSKRERDRRSKMSKKIKFQEILVEEKPALSENLPKEKNFASRVKKNPLSPYERLASLFENHNIEIQNSTINSKDANVVPEGVPIVNQSLAADDFRCSFNPYEWFFEGSKESGNDYESSKQSKLILLKEFQCESKNAVHTSNKLFGNLISTLYESFIKELSGRILTISQIPGITKPWKTAGVVCPWVPITTDFGRALLPYLISYADAMLEVSRKGIVERMDDRHIGSTSTEEAVLEAALFHIATHVVKARLLVLKNNKRIKSKAKMLKTMSNKEKNSSKSKYQSHKKEDLDLTVVELGSENGADSDDEQETEFMDNDDSKDSLEDEEHLDQGFTRPRVLILCPFRGSAKSIIEQIARIMGPNTSVAGWERLEVEFSAPEENNEDNDDGEGQDEQSAGDKKKKRKTTRERELSGKPADWDTLFKQNVDDDFKLGIQVNPGRGKGQGEDKGVYLRLFSDFFISDIVIASPIGLRILIDAESGQEKNSDSLSSIEVVLLHQADVLYMQNWDHVQFILDRTNKMPSTTQPDTDFSRIRPYFLDGFEIK